MSTQGYKTLPVEYSQYYLNASLVGERIMSYAEWLREYKRVCPQDIAMLARN